MSDSGERIKLYDKLDQLVEIMNIPAHFMEDEPVRWVMFQGKKYYEGGRPDSFYSKGQFAEID